jgi:hypothetical protein
MASALEQHEDIGRVLRLLDAPSADSDFDRAKDLQAPNSGAWLFQNATYRSFENTPNSVLWIHGART